MKIIYATYSYFMRGKSSSVFLVTKSSFLLLFYLFFLWMKTLGTCLGKSGRTGQELLGLKNVRTGQELLGLKNVREWAGLHGLYLCMVNNSILANLILFQKL